jgi:rod shape-determining protein MreC
VASRDRTARVAVLGTSVQRSRKERRPNRGRNAQLRRLILVGLVLAALALLTISFRSPTSGALHDVQGYGASALRPFEVAAQRVARPFRDAYDYVSGLTSAKAENERLRRELRRANAQATSNQAAANRAAELSALLKFEQGRSYPKDFRAVNTTVISFPGGPFAQQVTIAAGSDRGLAINTPVVTADGLIGRVTNTSPSTSQVTLLNDPDSNVPAVDATHHVVGIIRHGPHGTLILDRVAKEQVIEKGDTIVTRGTVDKRYPDFYPYGIPIGTVQQVGRSDIATYLTVEVTPFARFGSLDAVAALVSTKRK